MNENGSTNVAKPVIGITAYAEPNVRWGAWDVPAAVIPLAYVRQVEAAGGRPLLHRQFGARGRPIAPGWVTMYLGGATWPAAQP